MNLYDNRPMSVVTNVVLKTSVEDKGRIVRLNKVFRPRKEFVSCDDGSLPCGWYAGGKFLECEIYPGLFNGLVLEELIEAIRKVVRSERNLYRATMARCRVVGMLVESFSNAKYTPAYSTGWCLKNSSKQFGRLSDLKGICIVRRWLAAVWLVCWWKVSRMRNIPRLIQRAGA